MEFNRDDFNKYIDEHTRYVKVSFFRDRVETSYGYNKDIKHWIRRAIHGYILDKKKDSTSFMFILSWKKGETQNCHIGRSIKRAIALYQSYEKKKDRFVESVFNSNAV